MNKIESIELIYRNPKIRGGRPCIVGTSLRVIDIVMAMQFGERSPEQMAEDYQLSLGQVYAALAYYFEHKKEIDKDIREVIRIGRELAKEGWGKPENSIFPLDLSDDCLEDLLDALKRQSKASSDELQVDSAKKRQIVKEFLA